MVGQIDDVLDRERRIGLADQGFGVGGPYPEDNERARLPSMASRTAGSS